MYNKRNINLFISRAQNPQKPLDYKDTLFLPIKTTNKIKLFTPFWGILFFATDRYQIAHKKSHASLRSMAFFMIDTI